MGLFLGDNGRPLLLLLLLLTTACNSAKSGLEAPGDHSKIRVVATTTIVGDVVSVVGGESIQLEVILPVSGDPHSFEPTPQHVAAMSEADLVFINGLGFEAFIEPMLESLVDQEKIISVSEGVAGIPFGQDIQGELGQGEFEADNDEHLHGEVDPHVWFDPSNVSIWTRNIGDALSAVNPDDAELYKENALAYLDELEELDVWIQQMVAQIPQDRRNLITNHASLTYFAERYGFGHVAAIVPGYSTLAEPSAGDLAAVSAAIVELNIPAVFVGSTENADLIEQVAEEARARLVPIYTGSLGESGGPAATYIDYMRTNVTAIVNALSASE